MAIAPDLRAPLALASWRWALAVGLASRLFVWLALFLVAPLLGAPPGGQAAPWGWDAALHWDAGWYQRIATEGYEFARDGAAHSVAFFPVFPLATRGLMAFGLSFVPAALLIANASFLAGLCVAHRWAEARLGMSAARAQTLFLACCPLSLFGALPYTEGLYLLLSALALAAWDARRDGRAALASALAGATRVSGMALAPALLWAAWREGRFREAWTALVAPIGLAAYMAYGAARWGDPLAFVHAQAGWRAGLGFSAASWLALWAHPASWGEALPATLLVFGGAALVWRERARLGPLATAFGLLSLAIVLASGATTSVDRYAYGALPVAAAFGCFFARHPRWAWLALAYALPMLASAAVRFARGFWVA